MGKGAFKYYISTLFFCFVFFFWGGAKIVPMADFQDKSSRRVKIKKKMEQHEFLLNPAPQGNLRCVSLGHIVRALCTKTLLIKNFPQPSEMGRWWTTTPGWWSTFSAMNIEMLFLLRFILLTGRLMICILYAVNPTKLAWHFSFIANSQSNRSRLNDDWFVLMKIIIHGCRW